jgi:hypothetical protein
MVDRQKAFGYQRIESLQSYSRRIEDRRLIQLRYIAEVCEPERINLSS